MIDQILECSSLKFKKRRINVPKEFRNKKRGDCVIQSICVALDRSYHDVLNGLLKVQKQLNRDHYDQSVFSYDDITNRLIDAKTAQPINKVHVDVFHSFLIQNGFKKAHINYGKKDLETLRDPFPKGTFIVVLGNHMTVVVDQVLIDNHNYIDSGRKVDLLYKFVCIS